MRYNERGRFAPTGLGEHLFIAATGFAGLAHVGLDAALAVLIGTSFRARAPWAFMLAIALGAAWAAASALMLARMARLLRLLNRSYDVLRHSRTALVLPVGVESLSGALGSACLLAATLWVTARARDGSGVPEAGRFSQWDVYFPLAIGFQILALPPFVRLADIFSYAEAKATRELDRLTSPKHPAQRDLATGSTNTGSLISAESLRAAQRELDSARARHERQERRERSKLTSVSTGGSAQSVRPQAPVLIPLVPPTGRPRMDGAQSDGGRARTPSRGAAGEVGSARGAFSGPRQPDALTARALPEETRIDIFSSDIHERRF